VPVSVTVRDTNLVSKGLLNWSKVDITARYNQVGAWAVTIPDTASNRALAGISDLGVVVNWNGVYTFTGYLETWAPSLSVDAATGAVTNTLVLSGADDLGLIANRIAYPAPGSAWSAQTTSSADAQTGHLETVIKHYVNVNCGPGALAARRAPHLTVAADAARGATVSYSAKFSTGVDLTLMNIIRTLVATGGPLGVSVVQSGGSLIFDCYVPRDLSTTAWFSPDLGNLRGYNLSSTTPTATNAMVRGQTTFAEVTGAGASDGWQHIEVLVDQSSTTDATQITQAGTDAITQGAGAVQLQITAVDLPRLAFGTDYGLGDKVTVEYQPGVTSTDIVSAIQLVADASSGTAYTETVTPTIGASQSDIGTDKTALAKLAAEVRALRSALQRAQLI
jgi:Siphovirus ReqiPepy6 Gp37-like protein